MTKTPNYEYVRLDVWHLISDNHDTEWLKQQPDCEWREDYQCFFILKGSKTHTLAALKYGGVFE
jgi:hypothetical protein